MITTKRRNSITVQTILLTCEAVLWLSSLYFPAYALGLLLLCDIAFVSPLKAGRAFFFETLTADPDAARLSLLFRYFRHGYTKTVGWRLLTWMCRTALYTVCIIPPFLLLTYTQHPLALICSGLWLIAFIVFSEILLLRLLPIPYLLSRVGTLTAAVALSLRITRGNSNRLLTPVIPLTSQAYIARAAAVHELLRKFNYRNTPHRLQRVKKYGRMSR